MAEVKDNDVKPVKIGDNKVGIVGLISLLEEAKLQNFTDEKEMVNRVIEIIKNGYPYLNSIKLDSDICCCN